MSIGALLLLAVQAERVTRLRLYPIRKEELEKARSKVAHLRIVTRGTQTIPPATLLASFFGGGEKLISSHGVGVYSTGSSPPTES
jgi:hypothetical protein